MYRLKFKVIPSFKFVIGKDFRVQMFRESRKNLPLKDETKDKLSIDYETQIRIVIESENNLDQRENLREYYKDAQKKTISISILFFCFGQ